MKRLFTYPCYGTPDGYPEYTAHSGQIVEVLGPAEDGLIWIRAADGWEGQANPDELTKQTDAAHEQRG